MPTIDLGSVVGPRGAAGATGATGAQGIQGIPGPNQVSTNTSTTLNGVLYGNGSNVYGTAPRDDVSSTSNNLVKSSGIYAEVHSGMVEETLFDGTATGSSAVDISGATSSVPVNITLAHPVTDYKMIVVFIHQQTTTGSRRGGMHLVAKALGLQADYVVATNGNIGSVRLGVDTGNYPAILAFYGTSLTGPLYVVRVYGYR